MKINWNVALSMLFLMALCLAVHSFLPIPEPMPWWDYVLCFVLGYGTRPVAEALHGKRLFYHE